MPPTDTCCSVAADPPCRALILGCPVPACCSREFLNGLKELAELHELGVLVADTKLGVLDLATMGGQLNVAFSFAQSEAETKRLGERSKRGLRGQTERGYSSGGRPAYGLARKPDFSPTEVDADGRAKRLGVRLVPDPTTAPIVRRIFEMFAGGESMRGIAGQLNQEGVPTRDAGRTFNGRRNSGTWSTASISGMLENPIYVGRRVWNAHSRTGRILQSGKKALRKNTEGIVEVHGFVEPIIEPTLWERVQTRRKATRSEYEKRGIARPGRGYLLSGLIQCADCGHSFVLGAKVRGEPHYRCGFRSQRGTGVCQNKTAVSRPGLERKVRYVLDIVAKDPEALQVLVAEHNRRVEEVNEGRRATVRALEQQRDQLQRSQARLTEAIKASNRPIAILVAEMDQTQADLNKVEERIKREEAEIAPLLLPNTRTVRDFLGGRESIFEGDDARDRQFLDRVLEGIYVYPGGAIVMRFREDCLFAPVRGYEFHPEQMWERGVQGDRWLHQAHRQFSTEFANAFKGAELRVLERKGRAPLHRDGSAEPAPFS